MSTGNASVRSILLGLGMGDYNATLVIPYVFMAPAQTDPQMPPVVMLTRHLQQMMKSMGARAVVTGSIDESWSPYFRALAGDAWNAVVWFDIARTLIEAKKDGLHFRGLATGRLSLGDTSTLDWMTGTNASEQLGIKPASSSLSSTHLLMAAGAALGLYLLLRK